MSVNKATYCLLGGALLVLLSFRAVAVQVSIGEKSIQVPSPTGFSDVTEVLREQFDLFSDILPETNRLHAVFVSEGDTGLLLKAEEAELDQYFVVQSVRAFDKLTLSKSQFSELRAILRKEYAATFQKQGDTIAEGATKSGEALSSILGTEVAFNVSGVATLGIDEESVSHMMMSFLSKYGVQVGEESTKHVVAGTMIVALINGKVLYVNVYRTYESDEDIQWTRSQAKNWLPLILAANQRPWPLADGQIVPQGTLLATHIEELITGDQTEFRTIGHPKSHGVDVGLRYPSSWTASEGIRPHIVQKFTGQAISGITPSCMIIVQELPAWASLFMQDEVMDEVLSENIKDMAPPGAVVLDTGLTKLDGESGAWLKYYYAQERAGINVGIYSLHYTLFYRGKMLAIQCSVGGVADQKDLLEDAFLTHLPLFQSIGKNVVLHSKWNDSGSQASSSFMEEMFGEFWVITLLLSAVLTWGVGLLPPLITRFAIIRHPMNKQGSLIFVASFWLLNVLLFTALGSTSQTHTALFLVAWASFAILRKGSRSYDKQRKQNEARQAEWEKEQRQYEKEKQRMEREWAQWEDKARKAREDAQRAQDEARAQEEAARSQSHRPPDPQAERNEEYYARVLGLSGRMTHDDVRKKYHALASKYHPDRVHHLGDRLKEVADREMREINEAFDFFRKKYRI